MCTSVLFNFSNLLDHVDVQPHTLYKINRYRAELHRKVYVLVEAGKEYTACLTRFYRSGKLHKGGSLNDLPSTSRLLRNSVNTESNLFANTRGSS